MNINDIQKPNSETQLKDTKMQGIKNYAAQKGSSGDFSYYVEVTKSRDIKNETEPKNTDNPSAENQEEVIIMDDNTVDNAKTSVYVQSFNIMNSELFDLGIGDDSLHNFSNNDRFEYNIDLKDLTLNDIKLFEGLSQKNDVTINSVDSNNQNFNMIINGENLNISYKSIEVSKTLFSALEQAAKTGKSVRRDFGQDASVILRIGKDGKLSADFVPNEKAMEAVLKNALPQLKAKLDEQNLPYGELNYRSYNQQKNNKQDNNKEKKDE